MLLFGSRDAAHHSGRRINAARHHALTGGVGTWQSDQGWLLGHLEIRLFLTVLLFWQKLSELLSKFASGQGQNSAPLSFMLCLSMPHDHTLDKWSLQVL